MVRRTLHPERQSRIPERLALVGGRQGLEEPSRIQLRIVECFDRVAGGRRANALGLQLVEHLLLVARGASIGDQDVQRSRIRVPGLLAREAFIGRQVTEPEDVAQAGELRIRAHVDGDPVVVALASIDVVGSVMPVRIALGRRVATVHRRVHDVLAQHRQEPLGERHLDELSLARALAVP